MIIINTANLHVGGGVQVATAFILDLILAQKTKNLYFILSKEVYDRVSDCDEFKEINYQVLEHLNPVKLALFSIELRHFIKLNNVKAIFSVFGPSYMLFLPKNVKHYVGFANPWILYKSSPAYYKFSLVSRIVKRAKYFAYEIEFKLSSDFFIVETDEVKNRLNKNFLLKNKPVEVVSNCFAPVFNDPSLWDTHSLEGFSFPNDKLKFCTISHDYSHKQLDLIPDIKKELLEKYGIDALFYVTLSEDRYDDKSIEFKSSTINVGVLKPNQCPILYQKVDAVFLPTLLECFSASYPESMKMKKPIFTSNLGFAKAICKDAAFYFDPLSISSICETISKFSNNNRLIEEKVNYANETNKLAPTSMDRTLKYLKIIGSLNETSATKHQ